MTRCFSTHMGRNLILSLNPRQESTLWAQLPWLIPTSSVGTLSFANAMKTGRVHQPIRENCIRQSLSYSRWKFVRSGWLRTNLPFDPRTWSAKLGWSTHLIRAPHWASGKWWQLRNVLSDHEPKVVLKWFYSRYERGGFTWGELSR
jgi:hypothetical protein